MQLIDNWKNWAKNLKLQTYTLYLASKNPRVPWYAKVFATIIVAYAFSPIDLIPDFIPILGYLDDLILIPLGISLVLKMIPKDVWEESKKKAKNHLTANNQKNWIAAAIIILLWIGIAVFFVLGIMKIKV